MSPRCPNYFGSPAASPQPPPPPPPPPPAKEPEGPEPPYCNAFGAGPNC